MLTNAVNRRAHHRNRQRALPSTYLEGKQSPQTTVNKFCSFCACVMKLQRYDIQANLVSCNIWAAIDEIRSTVTVFRDSAHE
jgi:hypothetical protein